MTGVQTCALPISGADRVAHPRADLLGGVACGAPVRDGPYRRGRPGVRAGTARGGRVVRAVGCGRRRRAGANWPRQRAHCRRAAAVRDAAPHGGRCGSGLARRLARTRARVAGAWLLFSRSLQPYHQYT